MLNHCSENGGRARGPKPWRKPPNAAAVRQSRCNKRDRVRAGVRPPVCDQRRSVTPFSPASREALGRVSKEYASGQGARAQKYEVAGLRKYLQGRMRDHPSESFGSGGCEGLLRWSEVDLDARNIVKRGDGR